MNAENEFVLSRGEKITLQGIVVFFWLSAFMVLAISGWFENTYRYFGKELPAFTELFLHSMWWYFPFIVAFLLSVLVIYQIYRPHARTLLYGLWNLGVWAVYLLLVLWAVALPFYPACAAIE